MIKNLFIKYPLLSTPIIFSLVVLLYSIFITTPKYKTESIIHMTISDRDSLLSSSGLFSSVLSGSSSNKLIYQLKEYFESDSGANDFINLIDTNDFYMSSGVDFFSAYKPNIFNTKISDYLNKKIIKINILPDSESIQIITYGFTKEKSFRGNITSILMASNYLDKIQQLNSQIARVQRLCQIYSDSNYLFLDQNELKNIISKDDLKDINSGYKLLSIKANKYLESCQNSKNLASGEKIQTVLPESTLREINIESVKTAVGKIYNESIDAITMSENLTIVTEPLYPYQSESKYSILKFFLAFFFTFLISLTIKILVSMKNDFKL